MSKKKLLNESQVRQFMKLAKLEPLTPGFVNGLAEGDMPYRDDEEDANTRLEEEEDLEADLDATEDELGDMDAEADAEGEEIDDLEADLDMDAEAPAPAEGRMVAVDDFLAALETALEDAMGEEVEIDSEEVEDEAPVDDVEMDVELTDDGAEMDMGIEMEDPEELVNEVANRVQARLNGMKNETALVERVTKQVAARILKKALARK